MTKRLLTFGLVAVGLIGCVMAANGATPRAARLPGPPHPGNDAARARQSTTPSPI